MVEQLGLYRMFHQNPKNQLLHHLALPLIFYSIWLVVSLWGTTPLYCLLAFNFLCYQRLDFGIAAWTTLWLALLAYLAYQSAAYLSLYPLLGIATFCQVLGWGAAVYWGHHCSEAQLLYQGKWVSSNIYFDKNMFILRNVGRKPSYLDAFLQYNIAPFNLTLECLVYCGYKENLEEQIVQQIRKNIQSFRYHGLLYEGAPASA